MNKKITLSVTALAIFSLCFGIRLSTRNDAVHHDETSEIGVNFEILQTIEEKYKSNKKTNETLIEPHDGPIVSPGFGENWIDFENISLVQSTHFNMVTYFENLDTYFPENSVGSCGFVSLIQAMSYYDTFYSDNVIPEVYDRHNTSATTLNEAESSSPGVLHESFYDYNYSNYHDFCHATQSNNFQSLLTVLHNINLSTDNQTDFHYSIGAWDYDNVFDSFYGESSGIYVTEYYDLTQSLYEQAIKSIIDSGNPAIVHISKNDPSTNDVIAHSVVAYDYDDDHIYANFGYGVGSTHIPLIGGSYEYSEIYYAASLNFSSIGHTHSNNYVAYNYEYCGCNLSDKIYVYYGGNWSNIPPTLQWMKNVNDPGESYIISLRNSPNGTNIESFEASNNQTTLSFSIWKNVLEHCTNTIYISLQRIPCSFAVTYNETITTMSKPYQVFTTKTLTPADYGFPESYPTNSSISDNYHRHYLDNGFSFRTRRYRTGYIQQEYIVMSCIKTGITEAFLEYAFDFPITRIDVDMSHWREDTSEWLDSNTGISELQIWHEGNQALPNDPSGWIQHFDFLSSSANMSRDRTNPSQYSIYFSQPVFGFRFYSKVNSPMTSQTNKGRVCIGDMTLYVGDEI